MNGSERGYYEHLLQEGGEPANIDYIDSGVPDFATAWGRVLVKKRYGDRIILHSDVEESFITNGGESDYLAIMPEDPDESPEPLSVIPLEEVGDASDGIPQPVIEEHSPGGLPEYFGTLGVTLANRNGKSLKVEVPGDLLESVEKIADSEPEFDGTEQVARAALREYVTKKQDYGEAT